MNRVIKNIEFLQFDTLSSTNTWALKNIDSFHKEHLTCVSAKEQTEGRGRFNRKWVSHEQGNIYATFVFFLPSSFPYLSNLGQILSLSCASLLQEKGFQVELKWPNDILLHNKKVAGILCETSPLDKEMAIALGIGINVNMSEDSLSLIDKPATSLSTLSQKTWDTTSLLQELAHRFKEDLLLLEKEGFTPFLQAYKTFLFFRDKKIYHTVGSQQIEGVYHDIDTQGALIMQLPSGDLVSIYSGEISTSH